MNKPIYKFTLPEAFEIAQKWFKEHPLQALAFLEGFARGRQEKILSDNIEGEKSPHQTNSCPEAKI